MDRIRTIIGYNDLNLREKYKNSYSVAILDSGVAEHPDLMDSVVYFQDWVNGKKNRYDDNSHGTHVIGCIAGNGSVSHGRFRGITPNVNLVVHKVLNQNGEGKFDYLMNALSWLCDYCEQYAIRVVNISIGINNRLTKEQEKKLIEAITTLYEKQVLVVCAAGNDGPETGSLSSLGKLSNVFVVGCYEPTISDFYKCYDRDNLEIKERLIKEALHSKRRYGCQIYSGRGDYKKGIFKPDLVAPGSNVVSCNAFFRKQYGRYLYAYTVKSGTSMAAPIVSGTVALMLQIKPDLSIENIVDILKNSALDLQQNKDLQGAGILYMPKLIRNCIDMK